MKLLAELKPIMGQVPERDLPADLAPGQLRLSGENATHWTQPRGRSGGLINLTNRPVRTSKRLTLGTGAFASAAATSRPSGENAMPVMKEFRVRRSSVPIRSRARGVREFLATCVWGRTLDFSMAESRTPGGAEAQADRTRRGPPPHPSESGLSIVRGQVA